MLAMLNAWISLACEAATKSDSPAPQIKETSSLSQTAKDIKTKDSSSPDTPAHGNFIKSPQIELKPESAAAETLVAVLEDRDDTSVEITFPWRQNVHAALFNYGGRIWLVFDRPGKLDTKDIPQGPTKLIKHVAVVTADNALAVVLEASENTGFYMEKGDRGWTLALQKNAYFPSVARELVKPQYDPEGQGYAWLKGPELAQSVKLQDEVTHTTLFVVPTPLDMAGESTHTPDYETLKTYRGYAIISKRDGLNVTTGKEAVFIQADAPLNIATKLERDPKRQPASIPQLVKLEKWGNEKDKYFEIERALQVQAQKHIKGRLRLARFYLANMRTSEAMGELNLAARQNPSIMATAEFAAARTIALALAHRTDEAWALSQLPILQNEPEIRLWQGYILLQKEGLSAGIPVIMENLYLLQKLPSLLRNEISRQTLRGATQARAPGHVFLDMYDQKLATEHEREELILRRALLEYQNDRKVEGQALLDRALQSTTPAVRVEATLADTQLRPLDADAEIRKLEGVRYDWRGNKLESRVLQRLADLYLQKKDPSSALRLLRQLITYFDDTDAQTKARHSAQKTIVDHLKNNPHLDPVSFVKFISEFDDLMPQEGQDGVAVAFLAADKYAELGVLEKAQMYLERALSNSRSESETQAQALQRLANLYVLQKNFDKAISLYDQALALTPQDTALQSQRRLAVAQAREAEGDFAQAAATLKEDGSEESLNLQLNLFWREKKWDQAADTLEKLIALREKNNALTPDLILNLAVAYDHGGKKKQLKELAGRYGSLMNKSPLKAPFDILTSPEMEVVSHDRKALQEQLARTKQLMQQAETSIAKLKGAQ